MTNLVYHAISSVPLASPFDAAIARIARNGPVRIVSPYIDVGYLSQIVAISGDWKVVSDVEEWLSSLSVRSRPPAWQFIREHIDRIHHCTALHAKTVIGSGMALIGSANLTRSGLTRREEMGVFIDDVVLVDELHAWFGSLWRETSQPLVDENDAFVQWLDKEAGEHAVARERFVVSTVARKVRSYLISHAQNSARSVTSPTSLNLATIAKTIVSQEQHHYDSLAQALMAAVDARLDGGVFTLADVVREARSEFPQARVREVLFLVIQRCANHPRSVFVESTENHLVLASGCFTRSSRDEVLTAVAPFDTFLVYVIGQLAFDRAKLLPSEAHIEKATGMHGHIQTILTAELLACELLAIEDVAGELPRYRLRPEFEWDGRFRLFSRARDAWVAAAGSAPKGGSIDVDTNQPDTLGPENRYGREGPSALDQAWNAIQRGALKPHPLRQPSLDECLAQLLSGLFAGQALHAPNTEALKAIITRRSKLSPEAAADLLNGSGRIPRVVRVISGDDGGGYRVEIDPGLTWAALAAYPKTQAVCERFLVTR